MKNIQYLKTALFLLFSFFAFSPINGYTEVNSNNKIHFYVDSKEKLFNITNFKPGDSFEKTLKVTNDEEVNLDYYLNAYYSEGSIELFEELNTMISIDGNVVFKGKIKDFNYEMNQQIPLKNEDVIKILIEIPYELGNEFQGSATEFNIEFLVDIDGEIIPVGNNLPETATSSFQNLLIGAILVISGISLFMYQSRKKIKLQKD